MSDQNYETASRLGRTIGLLVLLILILSAAIAFWIYRQSQRNQSETHDMIDYVYCATPDNPQATNVFKQNCAVCHTLNDKTLVAPSLFRVLERVPSDEWFVMYVQYEDSLISSGDAYTEVINEYGYPTFTHNFSYLSKSDMNELVEGLKK